MPLPVAGVAQSSSPLASLMTFLSTLVVHREVRAFHEAEAWVASSSKGHFSLDMGRVLQGMFFIVGIGILLGFVVGILLCSGREEESEGNVAELVMEGCWSSDLTLETWDGVCR